MSTPSHHNSLPAFAIRRPVTMGMLFLSLLVVGAVAWNGIPLRLLPAGFDPPFLWVWISYPNASPIEIQEQITSPVEEAFWTVKDVKHINSRSRENGCGIWIEYTQNADMSTAYLEIRDRLERVRPELPSDLRYIYIRRFNESDEPILYCSIAVSDRYDDPIRLVEEEIVRRLEHIDGVASVELSGGEAKTVQIEFRMDRLRAHNVDISALIDDLRDANFALAGGKIYDGGRELLVRVDSRLKSLDELRGIPIRVPRLSAAPPADSYSGRPAAVNLTLGDIARVTYRAPARRWVERIDRTDAIELTLYKQSDANTVELTGKIRRMLDEISQTPRLSGIKLDVLFDQGDLIIESLHNLQEAGVWGAIFAVGVLFFFLRRVRLTLFITLAIPVSLLATVICMYFMNWSLNIITLSGLMISVGLVVDNAIVVVENIHSVRRQGFGASDAAIRGASEVALPITMATLTTVVVFLPLILMSGDRIFAFFMLRIGLPVIFALLASLAIALLLIPLAAHRFGVVEAAPESPVIEAAAERIEMMVRWTLQHRRDAFLLLLILMASTAIPISRVVSVEAEEGHINDFQLRFNFPGYYSMSRIDSTLMDVEDYLDHNRDRYDIKSVMTGFRSGFGRIQVFLNKPPARVWFMQCLLRAAKKVGLQGRTMLTRKEVIEEIKEKVAPPPGVEMFTSWRRRGGEEAASYVTVFGEDTRRLIGIGEDMRRRLADLPSVIAVETDMESSEDEIRIRFDRERTGLLGVDAMQAAFGMGTLVRGWSLPPIRIDGHDVDAQAILRPEDRQDLSAFMNLPVAVSKSKLVQVGDVSNPSYARGIGEISREDRRTRLRLKVVTTEDNLKKLSTDIDHALKGLRLPVGYDWGKGEEFRAAMEASRERNQAWMLAVVFVFLLMGALFESFMLPWSVIVTVPFSFFGVWWMLLATGTQFGVMAGVGVVVLIGVVVNNAIVLVDKINRLRAEGVQRGEAIAMGSRQRFRPIVMTALTTVMGLVPMAVGDANMVGIPYAPMGRAMIGGMLAATLLTPAVVALTYSLIDDFSSAMKRFVGALGF